MLTTGTASATQDGKIGNSFVESLRLQLDSRKQSEAASDPNGAAADESTGNRAVGWPLAVIPPDPDLDLTVVRKLRHAGVIVLRAEHEALSKTLETGPLGKAVCLAADELGAGSLTLIGHSRAASVPMESRGESSSLLDRLRLGEERLEVSKLKLRDDFARFSGHRLIEPLLSGGRLSLHALFYIHESDMFLKYEVRNDQFVPIVQATGH